MNRQSLSLVLASASPRRREMLQAIGLEFSVLPSGFEEKYQSHETPQDYVLRNSRGKATDVANSSGSTMSPHTLILGVDTIVVTVKGDILEKPSDVEDAVRMLQLLQGVTHTVYSGYSIVSPHEKNIVCQNWAATHVTFRPLTEQEIRAYVATGEPMDKAGAYGVQSKGAAFIKALQGSYTNVVGLPLCELIIDLQRLGLTIFK